MTFSRYSEAIPDARGYMSFAGDLYEAGRSSSQLATDVQAHLRYELAPTETKVAKTVLGTRRRLAVTITRCEADLTDPDTRQNLLTEVKDQVYRFGYDRSNYQTDLYQAAFVATVAVGPSYWALRQRQDGPDLVEDKMKVTTFRKTIKPGDRLEVLAGENAGRDHQVLEVASRIVTDDGLTGQGRFHWDFPIAEAFLCDGERVRIAKGTTERPNDYVLLRWTRQNPE